MESKSTKVLPLITITWVIDRQNLQAIPVARNRITNQIVNCLTNETINNYCERSTAEAYAEHYGVDKNLVSCGNIVQVCDYLNTGVSLEPKINKFYELIKNQSKLDYYSRRKIAQHVFEYECVDLTRLVRFANELSMGVRKTHYYDKDRCICLEK